MFKQLSIILISALGLSTFSNPILAQKPTLKQSNLAKYTFKGIITDELTGQKLSGASIYIAELKKGVVSNAQGQFQIQLSAGNYIVEASYLGYSIYVKNIQLNDTTTKQGVAEFNFALNHSAVESPNVTVTSFLRATSSRKTPTPINIIKKDDLLKGSGTNLIDALSQTPGVTQLTTGPAISKPIIRGLGYNRVMVLNDGVKQEGQQWGDEHGIEIDEYNVTRIEVLKVPASIIYGSEALSGVINIVSNVPVAEGAVRGNIFSNYQSNNHLVGTHFDIAGNKKGFVWGVNGSSKTASDYQNKYDGYVFNSKFKELDASAYAGIERDWGYTHFFVSQFNQKLGMIEGVRNMAGNFTKQLAINAITGPLVAEIPATDADFASTNPSIPYQHIIHTKYTLDNSIKWGEGRLKANIAYQRNERMEYGNIVEPTEKSLYFDLGTLNYSFQYLLPEKNNWKHTIGVNGMQQQNKNKGVEALIPEYATTELGMFFFTQKKISDFTFSGGARIDKKGVEFNELLSNSPNYLNSKIYIQPQQHQKDFGDIAGSFGMTYEASKEWVFKLNIARGYRAPNMSELGSNGAHEGTNRYEYGNPNLSSEKSLQFDLGAEWSNEHVSFTGNVFYNMVTGYIYYQKLNNVVGGDSTLEKNGQKFYAFAYQQQNANLYGAECNLDFHPHPLDGLHIENTLSYVRGVFNNPVNYSSNLPNIPPFRWLSEIKYEFGNATNNKNNYVSVQLDNVSTQNNPFTGYNTETATPGYTLINVGMGTHIKHNGKQICTLTLVAQNLTDIAYQNHLSRLKYTDENLSTGRMGVYNMGRNFSLKLNVPLVFD
jgi:iron complex outermembrane receptor protein